MKIFCLLIFFCNLLFLGLFAQQKVCSGTLRDSVSMQPIASASIILRYISKSEPKVSFSLSDSMGNFSITYESGSSFTLDVNAIGYNSKQLRLSASQVNNLPILMQKAEKLLPEVNVSAKQKIKVKDDTTSFLASAFSKKNESNVEDLLKKLPGFDVDNNGNIRYNGKQIERVLLDGDDLYGDDYKMLTKNLSADAVETVQAVDNFNNNKLLSGLGKSDKLVLNLKLKKNKTKLNANLTLGGGVPNGRYENRINLLSVSPSFKGIALGSLNNIGITPFSFINPEKNGYLQKNTTESLESMVLEPIVSVTEPIYRGVDARRANMNNSAILSTNLLLKAGKKTEIKAALYGISDNSNQLQYNVLTYLNTQPLLVVNEINALRKKQIFQAYSIDVTYRPALKKQWTYTSKVEKAEKTHFLNLLLINGQQQPKLQTDKLSFSQKVNYTQRVNDRLALDFQALQATIRVPQLFTIAPLQFNTLLELPKDSTAELKQDIAYEANQVALQTRLLWGQAKKNLALTVSYNAFREKFGNSIFAQKELQLIDYANKNFQGNFQVNSALLKGDFSYGITKKKTEFSFGSSINNQRLLVNDNTTNDILQDRNFVYFNQTASAGYKFKNGSKIRIQGALKKQLPQLTELFPAYRLTTYRNFEKGSYGYHISTERTAGLNYSYVDFYKKQILFFSGFQYSNNPANYIRTSMPSISFDLSQIDPAAINNEGYLLFGRLEKYTGILNGNIITDFSIFQGRFKNIINSNMVNTKFSVASLKLGFKSAWKGVFNINLITILKNNKQQTVSAGKKTSNSNKYFENQFNLYFIPRSERFSFELIGNNYLIPQGGQQKGVYFLDFNAQYVIKKDKLTVSFQGANLYNITELAFDNITPTQLTTQRYQLLPRFLIAKLYYKF